MPEADRARKLLRRWGGDDVAIFADTADAVRHAAARDHHGALPAPLCG